MTFKVISSGVWVWICLMKQKDINELVKRIVSGMPVEVFDDDSGEVWANVVFELVRPRLEGDFKGSREIGSANLVTALNLIHQKLLIQNNAQSSELSLKMLMKPCLVFKKNVLSAVNQKKCEKLFKFTLPTQQYRGIYGTRTQSRS